MSPGQIAQGGLTCKIRLHLFEFAAAIVWVMVGINYLIDSSAGKRSPIGITLHPWDYGWESMYVIAGPLIIAGIIVVSQRVRVAGLTLLGTGLLMNFIAALSVDPFELRDFTYLIFALACFIRGLLAAETVKPVVTKRARS